MPLLGDGMTQLVVFRAIQGFGGAGLFAMAFIIIADLFAPAERGRYHFFEAEKAFMQALTLQPNDLAFQREYTALRALMEKHTS